METSELGIITASLMCLFPIIWFLLDRRNSESQNDALRVEAYHIIREIYNERILKMDDNAQKV